MPLTVAAMDGIDRWGHRWRDTIHLNAAPARLRDPDKLVAGDCLTIRDRVTKQRDTAIPTVWT